MTRWIFRTVSILALVSSIPYGAHPESGPAATQQAAPAHLPSTDAQSSVPSASTPTVPAKKVWTNDDVGDLRGHSAISTVGVASAKPAKQPAGNVASTATINSYRNQILRLQGQLPDMDSKITELQGVLSGNTVNSTRHATGAKIDDWHDQLLRLQQQRAETASKISDLQDQARHSGVPENQIPE